jgi:hypothetical protein
MLGPGRKTALPENKRVSKRLQMETAHANCSPLTFRSPAIAARCGGGDGLSPQGPLDGMV